MSNYKYSARLDDIKKRRNECTCTNVIYDDELTWLISELRQAIRREEALIGALIGVQEIYKRSYNNPDTLETYQIIEHALRREYGDASDE